MTHNLERHKVPPVGDGRRLDVVDRLRSPETEGSILGDVLLRPDQYAIYRESGLARDHFARPAHQKIWEAVSQLDDQGATPDMGTVRMHLERLGTLDEVGVAYLYSLADGEPRRTPENVRYLVARLDQLRRCRAIHYAREKLIGQLHDDPGAIDDGALSHFIETVSTLHAPDVGARFALLDDVELLNRPEPTWMVKGRMLQNSLACIYGPPEVGKTTAMVDLGCSVATGTAWLGAATTTTGPVVYVAAEGADTIQLKLRPWKVQHDYPLDESICFCTVPGAVNLLDAGETTAFIDRIRAAALTPSMVIFDTLARSMPGGDENSAKDMGLVVANADRVRTAFKATVILAHHPTKTEATERGSGALRGACDTMMQLTRTDNQLRLSCTKQKDAPRFTPVDVQMVSSGGGCVMQLATNAPRPTGLSDTQRTALHVLRSSFTNDGATSAEWQAAMPDVTERTFYRATKALTERGSVRKKGQKFVWTGTVADAEH